MAMMCYVCNGDFDKGYWLNVGGEEELFYCDDCAKGAGITDSEHAHKHTTIAAVIARQLGDDGQTWETEDGRTLDQLAEEHGAVTTTHPDKPYLTRHLFDDGSAIVVSEGAWDIEGSEPWSWSCEE